MTSVDGYTKAGVDTLLLGKAAVDHVHPPAGGGILVTSAYASTLSSFSGTGTSDACAPGGWGFETPAENVLDGVTSGDGFGWGYAEAGWYQVQFRFWLQLAGGSGAEQLRADFTDYADQATCEWQLPLTVDDGSLGRMGLGTNTTVTTPVYYSEGKDVTGDTQSAHQLILKWLGGGTLSNGTGGGASYAVQMRIAKLG